MEDADLCCINSPPMMPTKSVVGTQQEASRAISGAAWCAALDSPEAGLRMVPVSRIAQTRCDVVGGILR